LGVRSLGGRGVGGRGVSFHRGHIDVIEGVRYLLECCFERLVDLGPQIRDAFVLRHERYEMTLGASSVLDLHLGIAFRAISPTHP
jgi:hypothetical protein